MASEKMTGLFLFSILFNLFFSVYGYAFTTFPETSSQNPYLDISIDLDDLYEIGISFGNATSFNKTWGSAPTLIDQGDGVPLRVDWGPHVDGDYFQLQVQNPVERYLNTWNLPYPLDLYMGPEFDHYSMLYNSTLISLYEPEYDWVRGAGGSNFAFFLSPIPQDYGNFTNAVYETGIITVTYGEPVSITGEDEISIKNFIKWYYNTVAGANSYGLPTPMVWFMRIIFTLNVIAGVFMLKELSRF